MFLVRTASRGRRSEIQRRREDVNDAGGSIFGATDAHRAELERFEVTD